MGTLSELTVPISSYEAGFKLAARARNVTLVLPPASDEFTGVHVPAYRPPPVAVSARPGSPFENVTNTKAFVTGFPQSSIIVASRVRGKPARAVKLSGVPVSIRCRFCGPQASGEGGTNPTFSVRMFVFPNDTLIRPL